MGLSLWLLERVVCFEERVVFHHFSKKKEVLFWRWRILFVLWKASVLEKVLLSSFDMFTDYENPSLFFLYRSPSFEKVFVLFPLLCVICFLENKKVFGESFPLKKQWFGSFLLLHFKKFEAGRSHDFGSVIRSPHPPFFWSFYSESLNVCAWSICILFLLQADHE